MFSSPTEGDLSLKMGEPQGFRQTVDWGSRGILAEATQYLGHLCAVWCEGSSSRSWQHWHPFLRPLGESHLGSVLTSFIAELQRPASSPGSQLAERNGVVPPMTPAHPISQDFFSRAVTFLRPKEILPNMGPI